MHPTNIHMIELMISLYCIPGKMDYARVCSSILPVEFMVIPCYPGNPNDSFAPWLIVDDYYISSHCSWHCPHYCCIIWLVTDDKNVWEHEVFYPLQHGRWLAVDSCWNGYWLLRWWLNLYLNYLFWWIFIYIYTYIYIYICTSIYIYICISQ